MLCISSVKLCFIEATPVWSNLSSLLILPDGWCRDCEVYSKELMSQNAWANPLCGVFSTVGCLFLMMEPHIFTVMFCRTSHICCLTAVEKCSYWGTPFTPAALSLLFYASDEKTVVAALTGQVHISKTSANIHPFIYPWSLNFYRSPPSIHPLLYPPSLCHNLPFSRPWCIVICCNLMD